MKLLLDQGTPRSSADILRGAGFDAVHTGEIGFSESEDSEIIRRASLDGRIIVTLDADFHALLALSQAAEPSVIRIRIEGLRAAEISELLTRVLNQCADDLNAGCMITVTPLQIRVRRLPVS